MGQNKAGLNSTKHGVSFEEAQTVFLTRFLLISLIQIIQIVKSDTLLLANQRAIGYWLSLIPNVAEKYG